MIISSVVAEPLANENFNIDEGEGIDIKYCDLLTSKSLPKINAREIRTKINNFYNFIFLRYLTDNDINFCFRTGYFII